jgi:hypothetical protein
MRISRDAVRLHLLEPAGIGAGVGRHRHPDFGEPEQRRGRDEHIGEEENGKGAPIPPAQPEPKMKPNREMHPDEQHERDLAEAIPRHHPEVGDFVGIRDVDSGQDSRPASIYDVHEEQVRNREADHDLGRFPRGHAVMAASDERDESAKGVNTDAPVEQHLSRRRLPEGHKPGPRRFLRLHGDEAESVIRKMQRDIHADDEAAAGAKTRESRLRDQVRGNLQHETWQSKQKTTGAFASRKAPKSFCPRY